ncbi:hypothetical protein Lesp01_23750 [Lentzea sp. NBRC 102530]|nr:hypothetical protein Lesp01_23750 [Lentzea sp. NBRC 102530]
MVAPGDFFTIHLSDPKGSVTGSTGTRKVGVELQASGQTPGTPAKLTGVDLADLNLGNATTSDNAGVLTVTGIRSTLTNSEAFTGFYRAGDKLDDLTPTLGSSCAQLPEQPRPATKPATRIAAGGPRGGLPLVGGGIALLVTTSPGRRT